MDSIKKRAEIIDNKKSLNGINSSPAQYVVYFLNSSDDIVYVGKKTGTMHDVELYVIERAEKYFSIAYYVEIIEYDDLDDALAERILAFEPIFNKTLPTNNRFISINQAKDKYRIGKREFSQMAKRHGSYTFGTMIYILKSVFDDEVGQSQPYHKEMPKEGGSVVLIADMDVIDYQVKHYGHWYHFLSNQMQSIEETSTEDGSRITTIVNSVVPADEVYERLQLIQKNMWHVSHIIDHESFEITKDGVKKTLQMLSLGEVWVKAPSWETINDISLRYSESMRNQNAH